MDSFNKAGDIKDILYSRTVKAGKRIYYIDVKEGRNHDLYMSITESKKKIMGDSENPEVSFEKHKIFLYREDVSNFMEAMDDVLGYIQQNAPEMPERRHWSEENFNTVIPAAEDMPTDIEEIEPLV